MIMRILKPKKEKVTNYIDLEDDLYNWKDAEYIEKKRIVLEKFLMLRKQDKVSIGSLSRAFPEYSSIMFELLKDLRANKDIWFSDHKPAPRYIDIWEDEKERKIKPPNERQKFNKPIAKTDHAKSNMASWSRMN